MFSRKRPRCSDRPGPSRASKHKTSVRIDALVFPFFLTILPALAGTQYLAARSMNESDGTAISRANLATEARGTTTPDAAAPRAHASDDPIAGESDNAPGVTPNYPPSAVNHPTSGVLQSENTAIHPVLSRRCVIFNNSLCRALSDKRVIALAAVQTGALVSDGVTTRQFLHRGYTEVDPVARVFLGSKPTWGRMAPLGALQVAAGMWLAERMAVSRRPWIRRFWWLPQVLGIAGNAAATAHNIALR